MGSLFSADPIGLPSFGTPKDWTIAAMSTILPSFFATSLAAALEPASVSRAPRLTPAQIELARHALGLPNRNYTSYRNRFVAGVGHYDHSDWLAMTDAGFAKRFSTALYGGDDLFMLTRTGAEAALRPGESLDSEDFP
jgi:hypothetical protein